MKAVDIGRLGENEAARFLKRKRLKIIERNLHASRNELDIIAKDKKNNVLIFVEVKARTVDEDLYSKFGTPANAVTKQKQKRTLDAARAYIFNNKKVQKSEIRFDVVEVYISKQDFKIIKINHIENAFSA